MDAIVELVVLVGIVALGVFAYRAIKRDANNYYEDDRYHF